MEDLTPTETQMDFARSAAQIAGGCLGKPAKWIAARLGEAGLTGVLVPEANGGLGLEIRDVLPLVIECARGDLAFPLAESIVAVGAALKGGLRAAELVMSGMEIVTVAWDGVIDIDEEHGELRGNGVASHVIGGAYADWVLVRIRKAADEGIALLSTATPGISWRTGNELDLDRPDMDLLLAHVPLRRYQHSWDRGESWRWLSSVGEILRCADTYGSARASFEAAAAYTSTRTQFQRHLCFNQSVRHLLARDYCGLEAVRYSLEYAALLMDERSPEASRSRDVLCGLSAEHCTRAAENAIQLHGAVGFTRDLPLHRRLRRILASADIRPAKAAREHLAATLLENWAQEATCQVP